ncbi:MAG: hypothetical protein ACJ75S_02610 [Solirubrobacterales bacterium]
MDIFLRPPVACDQFRRHAGGKLQTAGGLRVGGGDVEGVEQLDQLTLVGLIERIAHIGDRVEHATQSRAGHDPKYRLRSGKIVDRDTTAHDGLFNEAFGHARCKRGERLISGGLRLRSGSGGVLPGQNVSMVESGPVPKLREWKVTINSDLGGIARKDFIVFAYCRE